MEERFNRKEAAATAKHLSALCNLRPRLESRQQHLLIRSLLLTRFIRVASLRHLQNKPEITLARRILSGILPELLPLEKGSSMLKMLSDCSGSMGNRLN